MAKLTHLTDRARVARNSPQLTLWGGRWRARTRRALPSRPSVLRSFVGLSLGLSSLVSNSFCLHLSARPGITVNEWTERDRGRGRRRRSSPRRQCLRRVRVASLAAAATATGETREREREIAQHKLGVWKRLAAAARATAAATQGRKTRERVFGSCASFRTSGNPYLATILLSGNFFILVTGRNKRVKKLPKHRKFDAMKISRPVTEEVAMASDVWTATRTASEYKDGPSSLPSGRL